MLPLFRRRDEVEDMLRRAVFSDDSEYLRTRNGAKFGGVVEAK